MKDNRDKAHSEDNIFHQETPEQKHSFRVAEHGNAVKSERELDSIPVYYQPKPIKKKKNKWLAPVILTIVSAGAISTILGILLLQLFVGIENEQTQEVMTTPVNSVVNPPTGSTVEKIPQISAYVLQAGVFLEQRNAEEWKTFYDDIGEPTFIWERDEQYFLFVGIFATEELAKQRVEELQADGHDVFFKPWVSLENEIEATKEAFAWIEQFSGSWELSLNEKTLSELLDLAENAPSTSRLESIVKKITSATDSTDIFYLELMHAYENL